MQNWLIKTCNQAEIQKLSCCIVIPVYQKALSPDEKLSLNNCLIVLKNWPICFIHPQSFSLGVFFQANAIKIPPFLKIKSLSFSNTFFASPQSYNHLMLSNEFYRKFISYHFILIHQLDAFVFKDKLSFWMEKGYDYLGAPWDYTLGSDTQMHGVGNGGLSLRKVSTMVEITSWWNKNILPVKTFKEYLVTSLSQPLLPLSSYSIKPATIATIIDCLIKSIGIMNNLDFYENQGVNEDYLLSVYGKIIKPTLKIPSIAEAAEFSLETNPRQMFLKYQVSDLFGCHAWNRYDPDFFLEKFGIQRIRQLCGIVKSL